MKIKHLILLLLSLSILACDTRPVCTSGKEHDWGQWEPTGRRGVEMGTWVEVRRSCKTCGWEQIQNSD